MKPQYLASLVFISLPLALALRAQQAIPAGSSEEVAINALRDVSGSLPSVAAWERKQFLDPRSGFTIQIVPTKQVKEEISSVRERLLDAVRQFPELRSYVANATKVDMVAGLGNSDYVRASDADKVWESVHRVANLLGSLPSLSVDLLIRSRPAQQATFRLIKSDGTVARETATDSTLGKVWRGEYTYVLELSDFKTITGTLDLVATGGGVLDCVLIPQLAHPAPAPCRLISKQP